MKRTCVLTGATGVLGTAFIKRFQAHYEIAAVHHSRALSCATQQQRFIDPLHPSAMLQENEHQVFSMRADLSSADSIDSLCTAVLTRFKTVDLLVNAAAHRRWRCLLAFDGLTEADLAMNVNVLAPLRLAVAFAQRSWRVCPEENARLRRNVVNISSTSGLYVYPDLGQAIYGTSKAALNYATYHLASEFWDIGIRVNAVAPNSFPSLISTERVLDQIAAFDASEQTGQLSVLDCV